MNIKRFNPFSYLESLNVDKMRFGLQSITDLLSRLGNPQKTYKTIIIAGTNGKGSTAAMTASILHHAGYKVGLYTSPHLVDVRERIVIDSRKISRSDFNQTIAYVKGKMGQPVTYFEFLTAVAFVYFQNHKVDIAVMEVGLGGRLDATNVCRPLVSVITNIAFDHMAYLGNTLESIAREKAGIIKQRGICLTAVTHKNVLKVLQETCLRRHAKLYRVGCDIKIKKQGNIFFSYQGFTRYLKNLKIPLLGAYQRFNAALALAVIEICEKKGFRVDDAAIYAGLQNTSWEARLEVMQENPLFILDGAHNPAGIDVLCRSLKKDFSYSRLILIFGALADKDYRRMLGKIAPLASKIILVQIKAKRAVPVNDLMTMMKKMGYPAITAENVSEAIIHAHTLAKKRDLICTTGSFYLAGEVKSHFLKQPSMLIKSR